MRGRGHKRAPDPCLLEHPKKITGTPKGGVYWTTQTGSLVDHRRGKCTRSPRGEVQWITQRRVYWKTKRVRDNPKGWFMGSQRNAYIYCLLVFEFRRLSHEFRRLSVNFDAFRVNFDAFP